MNLSDEMAGPATTAAPVEDARDWLEERLGEVGRYDRKTALQCADALLGHGGLDEADLEVLESLYLLAVAQPKVAERRDLSPAEVGSRLAQRLEHEGQADRAIAVLERTAADHPDSRVLERELAGVMRRAGQVRELVDRYLERARGLLRRGRPMEAIPWLQEVLLVDRSRRDVARLIRDLRYGDVESVARSKHRKRLALLALVLAALFALVGLRERALYRQYEAIAPARAGDLASWRARRDALRRFAADHPLWHRTLELRGELAHLRTEVLRLEEEAVEAARTRGEQTEQRRVLAEQARTRGVTEAEAGRFEAALVHFEEALNHGDGGWPNRDQTERDVKAIREWLEGTE